MFTAPVRYECEKLFGVSMRTGRSAGRARHSRARRCPFGSRGVQRTARPTNTLTSHNILLSSLNLIQVRGASDRRYAN
jgi:hypothetical protein